MLSTVLLAYSLLVFILSFALCIWLGYRRGVFNSAMRLGFFLFSGILAFVVTKLLVTSIGSAVSALLVSLIGEDIAVLTSMSTLQQVIVKLGGGLLAPVVFMLVFFVIDKLTFIAYIPLKKKLSNTEKLHTVPHDKLFGAILGGVLAFCITLTCVMPVGYLSFAAETTDQIAASSVRSELPDEMTQTMADLANVPAVKVNYALSGWLFRGLTAEARSAVASCFSLLDLVDTFQHAEDMTSISTVLQELPQDSLELLVSVAKDTLAQIVPAGENTPYQAVVNTLSQALDKLAQLREELSTEAYAKEIEALATITTIVSDPSSVTGQEVIKTVLTSSLLTEVMVDNRETLAEELSGITSELSKNEKKEIKQAVSEYADACNMDEETVSSVLSIFGIS
ncbi:MAG: hypothetical protein IKU56_04890 [Clostridia bacterium]|nr:hypothetical protein [Clostridia bacterium]